MTVLATPTRKAGRIGLRVSARQEQILKRAADVTDHTLSDFVLNAAMIEAQQVLADRRWFALSDEQFDEFLRLSDTPLPSVDKLAGLFAEDQ
ncbi:MAG: DUF1778 domain-containing protein [Propionibacteriaceae bacterium]|nr:DUF1778 domain-containing protein [Propionibacteriaceae bacterium]